MENEDVGDEDARRRKALIDSLEPFANLKIGKIHSDRFKADVKLGEVLFRMISVVSLR